MDELNQPKSLFQLYTWLDAAATRGHAPHLFPKQYEPRLDSVGSVQLWFVGFELPHRKSIEEAADKLWLHEEEAFSDLQLPANSLLLLRIEQARDLIGALITSPEGDQESPFAYPDTTFRELVHWLLVDWWEARGHQWAMRDLARRPHPDDLRDI